MEMKGIIEVAGCPLDGTQWVDMGNFCNDKSDPLRTVKKDFAAWAAEHHKRHNSSTDMLTLAKEYRSLQKKENGCPEGYRWKEDGIFCIDSDSGHRFPKQYCPPGEEWEEIGQVCKNRQTGEIIIKKNYTDKNINGSNMR